jgi:ABC-type glycerol-3-phosphate transport system permease component
VARDKRVKKQIVLHLLLICMAAMAVLPFAWLICASLKTPADLLDSVLLPWRHLDRLTLDNFRSLANRPFAHWLVNSIFLSSLHAVLVVTLSSLGGFALAKYEFHGKGPLMVIMLATLLMPSQVILPGSYELMYRLNWLDSYLAIIVPGAVSVFGIFLFRQSMLGVPDELLQCGRLDGCSEIRLWWDIALPTVRPMIGAYTLLSFLAEWNSFLWPQIVLQNEAKWTLPIGLNSLTGLPEYQHNYGIVMAATLVSILPVAVLFFALQRDFISGLSSGAVKG